MLLIVVVFQTIQNFCKRKVPVYMIHTFLSLSLTVTWNISQVLGHVGKSTVASLVMSEWCFSSSPTTSTARPLNDKKKDRRRQCVTCLLWYCHLSPLHYVILVQLEEQIDYVALVHRDYSLTHWLTCTISDFGDLLQPFPYTVDSGSVSPKQKQYCRCSPGLNITAKSGRHQDRQ